MEEQRIQGPRIQIPYKKPEMSRSLHTSNKTFPQAVINFGLPFANGLIQCKISHIYSQICTLVATGLGQPFGQNDQNEQTIQGVVTEGQSCNPSTQEAEVEGPASSRSAWAA